MGATFLMSNPRYSEPRSALPLRPLSFEKTLFYIIIRKNWLLMNKCRRPFRSVQSPPISYLRFYIFLQDEFKKNCHAIRQIIYIYVQFQSIHPLCLFASNTIVALSNSIILVLIKQKEKPRQRLHYQLSLSCSISQVSQPKNFEE